MLAGTGRRIDLCWVEGRFLGRKSGGCFILFWFSTLSVCSEEITLHRGEISLLLISDWVGYLVVTQMARLCLLFFLFI